MCYLRILCILLLVAPFGVAAAEDIAFDSVDRTFAERHAAQLDGYRACGRRGVLGALGRLAAGEAPDIDSLIRDLRGIEEREDCADFRVHSYIRLLYQFWDSPYLTAEAREDIVDTLLNFKYWPDEPGIDSMCTWSENHHILFSSAGYLLGQLWPDMVFANNGQTGKEKMATHRPRVERWLEMRYRTGFSEWLSHVYYDEHLTALANLVDFSADEAIATRAAMVTDLVMADMALNSFHGVFGSTHGRSYDRDKRFPQREATSDTQRLFFGMGLLDDCGHLANVHLALSEKYRMPRVIYEMANDLEGLEMINRQRVGIRVDEGERWGLGYDNFEDGMVWLSIEAYSHPRTINLMAEMLDAFGWWENEFFAAFNNRRPFIEAAHSVGLLPAVAWLWEKDLCRNTREEANLYTYRTPDYMLSSAQDYRKGYGGDQQHIWQATLGPEAVCFTTHPAYHDGQSPDYWTGSGNLPRVAQVENVALVFYRISTFPSIHVTHDLEFTHAWLPKEGYDEVVEKGHWIFARKDEGYLALYSHQPMHWHEENDGELVAPGRRNIWICELGRAENDGPFEAFMQKILAASLEVKGMHVRYDSPSQGELDMGYWGPLRQDGEAVILGGYPRYENPYGRVDFAANVTRFEANGHWMELDYSANTREAGAFLER